MKKFYSFLLAAVALVGFAACNQDFTADITPESGEMVSFKATIADETRVGLDGLKTIWVAGDEVKVDGYTFICQSDLQTFLCTEVGCSELLEEGRTVEAVYAANFDLSGEGVIDSTKGTEGAVLKANGSLTDGTLSFQIQSAFLKFTTTSSNVVLNTANGDELFSHLPINVDALTAAEDGSYYVAINPVSATLSYSIDGVKYKEITKTFEAGKIYNLGTLAPIYNVYVLPQPKSAISKWTKFNLYTWVEGGVNNTWPGADITANTKEINGYTYYTYQYDVKYNGQVVNIILNNGSDQTSDIKLGELNTDYYVVVNSLSEYAVYTTAPAAGSVPEAKLVEDPKPDTVSLYLKTTWGWTNWALYAWGGSGSWGAFNSWPGSSKYDATIDGVTYKAWDIPASCVGQTGTKIIVTGKENGQTKQSVDFPVSFKAGEDVFIEISSWNGTLNKCELKTIASPYTK